MNTAKVESNLLNIHREIQVICIELIEWQFFLVTELLILLDVSIHRISMNNINM